MKKLNTGLLGTAAVLAMTLMIPAPSHADAGKRDHGANLFAKADADKSGDVSNSEFRASAQSRFAAMDKNDDGFITKEEMEAAHAEMGTRFEKRRTERLAAVDADGDGKVSEAEYMAQSDKMFEKLDYNGDGKIEHGEGRRDR